MKLTDTLFVITARGGSKGLPGKNIKDLCGKPLIAYSIDVARAFTDDENICVSTDSEEIKRVVEEYGLKVPFLRPDYLATDTATSNDVLVHAVNYYKEHGHEYKKLCLLQPTSPLRTVEDVEGALKLYRDDIDMVSGMIKSHIPSILNEETDEGYMVSVFNKNGFGRQYVREMYETNGAVYVMNIQSLIEKGMKGFTRKVKYVMTKEHSVDIDDTIDFMLVETIIKSRK
ncbi:cytidylyltransferase domain-containing protein [Bacteroides ovatus]|uniref:acylneuraminate cytidylyltransferase family protein n=1 Tax=Bacteroides ovatus TaxID=28116 RepID=UPI001F2C3A43|nr:acylneuraminate cytidylyltransferase family protein [Bacteroides ovatus]MCE8924277.1 acylneuraminate cytidylyltransferase family protein [Bacteroides ovatus]